MKISGIEITHISACVPSNKESIADINCLSNASRFSKVTGIKHRRVADKTTLVSDLILSACNKIFNSSSDLLVSDVDILIVITQTGDNTAPGVALKLHERLGLNKNCICFDINLGCSSYPYGISVISSMLKSLNLNTGILCIGDVSTKLCHEKDPTTYPLFGDAGSCTVLKNSGFDDIFVNLYSDGSGRNDIIIPSSSLASEFPPSGIDFNSGVKNNSNMSLNGANVFSFAINKAPSSINELITKYNLTVDTIFLHQANKKINNFIEKKLSMPDVKFPSSLEDYGNTSSVSIPLTICSHYSSNNSLAFVEESILCCGFGVGLSWGSISFRFNGTKIYGLFDYE